MDESQTPSFAELLTSVIEMHLARVPTAEVGVVVDYDAATRLATVQPVHREGYGGEDGVRAARRRPVLVNVPVVFPCGRGAGVDWTPEPGDGVLLVFCNGSIDLWTKRGGTDVDPEDDRSHSRTDAIAIPGLFGAPDVPSGAPPANTLVVRSPKIRLVSDTAADPVIRRSDLAELISTFNAHTHAVPALGTSATALPQQTAIDGSPDVEVP